MVRSLVRKESSVSAKETLCSASASAAFLSSYLSDYSSLFLFENTSCAYRVLLHKENSYLRETITPSHLIRSENQCDFNV